MIELGRKSLFPIYKRQKNVPDSCSIQGKRSIYGVAYVLNQFKFYICTKKSEFRIFLFHSYIPTQIRHMTLEIRLLHDRVQKISMASFIQSLEHDAVCVE